MDTIYYIASCDTCRKIIKSLPPNKLVFRDIKQDPLTAGEVERMHSLSGSYEPLFSRKAQLYKSLGLKDKQLSESDYRTYLMQHYTFLSRPVFIIGDRIFIGNSQNSVSRAIEALKNG